jgi:hypothetical protein
LSLWQAARDFDRPIRTFWGSLMASDTPTPEAPGGRRHIEGKIVATAFVVISPELAPEPPKPCKRRPAA